MKWYILKYCHLLLFILSDCFPPANTLPALSKLVEKYPKNIREISLYDQYPYTEEGTENVSEECFSSGEDSEINLPDEPSKLAEKKGMSSLNETRRKHGSLITHHEEVVKSNASSQAKKEQSWLFNWIYPGTKWCGVGNIAANDDDLGPEEDTDKCCRIHDNCQDFILNGETKYNLTNKSPFVSLSCDCDNILYECLRQVNTTASNSIGFLYFNILAKPCFTLDYPKKCKKFVTFLKICSEYVTDTFLEVYQWLPAKRYKKL